MPLSRRYTPEWAPGDNCVIGIDFSSVVPPGVGILTAEMTIQTNTTPPVDAMNDWTSPDMDPNQPGYIKASVRGRAIYCTLQGGVSGTDYRLLWTITDGNDNIYTRTALMLCAPTS